MFRRERSKRQLVVDEKCVHVIFDGDDVQVSKELRKRIAANRAHLFVFITNRDVPYTNKVSERHLRPSVIFRKVTNGFRCEWGAETYAASETSSGKHQDAAGWKAATANAVRAAGNAGS